MKKLLVIVSLLLSTVMFNRGAAQCTFSNAGVQLTANPYTDPATGLCMISFDLYFDLQSNSGGKYVYVHIWPTSLYPTYNYANPPVGADLVNTVLSFGFYHHTNGLYMLSSYVPDPGLPNYQFTGLSVIKGPGVTAGYDRFKIEGVLIASSTACSIPQSFTADAWQSQSAAAQNVHCFSRGLVFYANDPQISGLLYCQNPRKYKFDITTINTSGLTVDYKVYLDTDGNAVYNETIDNILVNSGTATMNSSNNYKFSSGILDYLPYSGQKPYADLPLWVVVTSPSLPNAVYGLIVNTCIPLPVQFASFIANRENEIVELEWATASETNNHGFFVERKNGNGNWQQLAFIPSKALHGNSTQLISYHYKDNNTLKEVSQYRLNQVNLDGKTSYSEIRMVKGYGQTAKLLVFPNPSPDGQFNVFMENSRPGTTMQLLDMNGKIIRTWSQLSSNSFTTGNITPGIYIVRAWPADGSGPLSAKLVIGK